MTKLKQARQRHWYRQCEVHFVVLLPEMNGPRPFPQARRFFLNVIVETKAGLPKIKWPPGGDV
jgi:tryptophan synthase beta subunit